ncbi:MAG: flagellar basal body P-ring protein FlgI [Candidatus Baltobacteraceae bacterium]
MKTAASVLIAAALTGALAAPAHANSVLVKDVAHVQGVTGNQLAGYGLVTGLNGTGDSTSVVFTSHSVQNVLQSFGISVTGNEVRTRDVAAVMVTATLPAFAHSGDNVDVTVSAMGDSSSLQGGTLIMTELKAANDLVYATAQGPLSIGGFTAGFDATTVTKNHPTAGRIPNGAVIAHDMITPLQSGNGFNYVLTTPDYKTAANLARALNHRFGGGTAGALDAETIHVTLPGGYHNNPVMFLADASDVPLSQDELAKVVMNERTGTIVFGGNIKLAPCAIAHGNLSVTITQENKFVPASFSQTGGGSQSNTRVRIQEEKKQLTFVNGAPTLGQVVVALNTMGASPRDLIAIVQALRQAGALQADLEIQ